MSSRESSTGPDPGSGAEQESRRWVRDLGGDGAAHHEAVRALHTLLRRVGRREAARRAGTYGLGGRELEDLAEQAADDAVVAVLRRLDDFRGESRFTTWACKFVVLGVSTTVGRHVWRRDGVHLDGAAWERLPARLGAGPEEVAESRELVAVVTRAVAQVLTEHQRRVFAALVIDGVPLDALTVELGTNRNAVYKTMFDARRKLRRHLEAEGLWPATTEEDR